MVISPTLSSLSFSASNLRKSRSFIGSSSIEEILLESGIEPEKKILDVLFAKFGNAVMNAMASRDKIARLKLLYNNTKKLPSTNTLSTWAKEEHLSMNGSPPWDTSGVFNLAIFANGEGLIPLISKTLNSLEEANIRTFVAALESKSSAGTLVC